MRQDDGLRRTSQRIRKRRIVGHVSLRARQGVTIQSGSSCEMLETDEPFLLDVVVPYAEHVLPMIAQGKSAKGILTE